MPSQLREFYLEFLRNNTNASSHHQQPLTCSFIPPSSYWTVAEKESFFQGIAIHSRLQPELVQQHIGSSKTVWEVCNYIDILDEASLTSKNVERFNRQPYALEMSQEWVDFEEAQATVFVQHEFDSQQKHYEDHINAMRVGTSERASRTRSGTTRLHAKASEEVSRWKTRQVLRQLDIPKCRALDMILRDALETDERYTEDLDPETEAETSAVEARRARKRLFMRKYRAIQSGKEDFDVTTERLKAGRKKKLGSPKQGENGKKYSQRGLVAIELAQAYFKDAELEAEDLLKEGIELFNLTSLCKFSRLISERASLKAVLLAHEAGEEKCRRIPIPERHLCVEILSLLRIQLVLFLTEVIGRLIILVAQEYERSHHTRLFRHARDTARPDQVRLLANQMIGVTDQGVFLRELKANFKEAMDVLGHYFDDGETAKAIGRGNEGSDSDLAGSDDERRPRSASPSEPSTRLTRSVTAKTGMGNVLRDDTDDEDSSEDEDDTELPGPRQNSDVLLWVPAALASTSNFSDPHEGFTLDDIQPLEKTVDEQREAIEQHELNEAEKEEAEGDEKRLWEMAERSKRVEFSRGLSKKKGKRRRGKNRDDSDDVVDGLGEQHRKRRKKRRKCVMDENDPARIVSAEFIYDSD